jgi:prepilin-type processing-associated H-X9-DG protein
MLFSLPYIEQSNLYDNFNFSKNWFDPATNLAVVGTFLKTVQCPSSPNPTRLDYNPSATGPWDGIAAPTDYAAINSVDPRLATAGLVDAVSVGNGAMPQNSKIRFADITDGLSNTILVAESAGRPYVYRNGQQYGTFPTDHVQGGGWARAASDITLNGTTPDGVSSPGPCAINCTNGTDALVYPDPYFGIHGTGDIYAFHTGGANFLFSDGSVHFINQSIDIRTLAYLVTMSAGEVIDNTTF